MTRLKLIVSGIVSLVGLVTGIMGFAAFLSEAAVAAQTGNQSATGPGVTLVLLGLFLAATPLCYVVVKVFSEWRAQLSPEARRKADAAILVGLSAAAVGGYLANREYSHRAGERYATWSAASTASDAAFMAQIQANGGAGQPGLSASDPGQHGSGIDPTPTVWTPPGS
jgi:hypothetical protein